MEYQKVCRWNEKIQIAEWMVRRYRRMEKQEEDEREA
jgi:hypothetical protein